MGTALEIFGIVLSVILTYVTTKQSQNISSMSSKVGGIYNTLINKYNLDKNAIDQSLALMNTNLDRLYRGVTGSARISPTFRKYVEEVKKLKRAEEISAKQKALIDRTINQLQALATKQESEILSGNYSRQDVQAYENAIKTAIQHKEESETNQENENNTINTMLEQQKANNNTLENRITTGLSDQLSKNLSSGNIGLSGGFSFATPH